ncbi:hypothetical protein [uncultured Flavobacterium sp.]|uniref:hypothetical protein n=1 Tax=uncultured Flavobacterium sp. TaxID=165435 RepID=UPI0025D9C994|nr:hypothetical protein [uncultured Flavobacterium sp.]
MKYLIILLSAGLLTLFPHRPVSICNKPLIGPADTDTLVIGDIDNDKIIDTAFITGPKWLNDEDGWGDPVITPYEIDITFSCSLPAIHHGNAVMGYIEDIGDIDGDGVSEVIVVPIWFIGCWGNMEFYTLKDGQWHNFGSAGCHICTDEIYLGRITKLSRNKIKVMEDAWDEDVADRIRKPKVLRLDSWKKAK